VKANIAFTPGLDPEVHTHGLASIHVYRISKLLTIPGKPTGDTRDNHLLNI